MPIIRWMASGCEARTCTTVAFQLCWTFSNPQSRGRRSSIAATMFSTSRKLGFRSDVAEEKGRKYFRYDTSLPGNGNGGHDYGTKLAEADKRAIVEYMKRF